MQPTPTSVPAARPAADRHAIHAADPAWSPLLTDLYQLTMAYGYWRSGRVAQEAAFHLYFRTAPFGGGYTIACGLAPAAAYVERLRFADADLAYLATLRGADGEPLFADESLAYLAELRLDVDVDMVPEGTLVFPNEPLVRVRGPILHAQLLETALLTHVGFPTLVATKAARVCLAAPGDDVIEFGLRRAQGPDGGLSASRAAFVGGCVATSNLLAGARHGIPVRGTHAHSWVMSFGDERAAFAAYTEALPNNCVLLVDTYDTLTGVRHAIEVGQQLRARWGDVPGRRLLGVRLDSGDLAYLSMEARRLLDAAGFPDATILASNDLDEHVIESLRQQGAAITVWGVGTKLATAFDQPALGAVYKLTAVREPGGAWQPRVKVSEQPAKTTTPGILQVRRFTRDGQYAGDMLWDELHPPAGDAVMVDPLDLTRRKRFGPEHTCEELLVATFRGGTRIRPAESLPTLRARAANQLARFHPGVKRLVNPHEYPVGVELGLHERKTALVLAARGESESLDERASRD